MQEAKGTILHLISGSDGITIDLVFSSMTWARHNRSLYFWTVNHKWSKAFQNIWAFESWSLFHSLKTIKLQLKFSSPRRFSKELLYSLLKKKMYYSNKWCWLWWRLLSMGTVESLTSFSILLGLPCSSVGKESACRRPRIELGRSPGEGKSYHSSILA